MKKDSGERSGRKDLPAGSVSAGVPSGGGLLLLQAGILHDKIVEHRKSAAENVSGLLQAVSSRI